MSESEIDGETKPRTQPSDCVSSIAGDEDDSAIELSSSLIKLNSGLDFDDGRVRVGVGVKVSQVDGKKSYEEATSARGTRLDSTD